MSEKRELIATDPKSLKDGRYDIERLLGEGSMGRTYLAMDNESGMRVAVKALYPSRLADWKDLELFNRESGILQKLAHPQIPAYVDAFHEGEGDGVCYFLAQEWVKGESLREVMNSGKRFTEIEVVDLGRDILGILEYMQGLDAKVVHRDIKPDNIMIRDSDGRPTLVDFGAVREVVRLTMGGGSTIIGTYGYMPPEQLMGRAVPATDIYGLGVTLLECLTRETPQDLHGEDVRRLVKEVQVQDSFKRILSRMCAPLLPDRYASAVQVGDDLDRLAEGRELVHVADIEKDIQVREKEREQALKAATSPGIHYGYMTLVAIALVMTVLGVYFMLQALATSFQSGFLIAAMIGGVGLASNLVLLARRYIHDAWEPPKPGWSKTRATVLDVREVLIEGGHHGWIIEYEFPVRSSMYKTQRNIHSGDVQSVDIGDEFDVWYPPGKPQFHEAADIRHEHLGEMRRLFSPDVEHTPE